LNDFFDVERLKVIILRSKK